MMTLGHKLEKKKKEKKSLGIVIPLCLYAVDVVNSS